MRVETLSGLFRELEEFGRRQLTDSGVPASDFTASCSLDVRYQGQSYEINVPFSRDFIDSFHQEHRRLYDQVFPEKGVEVTTLRLSLVGPSPAWTLPRPRAGGPERPVHYRQTVSAGAFRETAVLSRGFLRAGEPHEGPVLIVDDHSTCLVAPEWVVESDSYGNLLLERKS
jgi:N-methylhydantoinase A